MWCIMLPKGARRVSRKRKKRLLAEDEVSHIWNRHLYMRNSMRNMMRELMRAVVARGPLTPDPTP